MSVSLTEADFARQVKDVAYLLGWEAVHFRPAQTSHGWRTPVEGSLGKGWPDWLFIRARDRRLVFAELKREGAKLSDDQERVLDVLRCLESKWPQGPRVEVFAWWPRDFDRIVEVLK